MNGHPSLLFAALVALVAACPTAGADAPMDYMHTAGPAADPLTSLGWGVTIISVLVIAIVAGLLGAGLLRRRPGTRDASGFPAISRDPGGIRWIYLGVGASILVLFGTAIWTFATFASVAKRVPEPELTVAVTGHQWWWEARYEGGDAAGGFSTANEIHIPTGRPVRLRLDSADVIHSFWVPKLAGKTDAIPGQTNLAWVQADAPGVFLGQCAEYCGLQHAHMALRVVARAPEEFRAWRDGQMKTAEAAPPPALEPGPAPAASPAPPGLRAGRADFATRCGLCHTVRGTAARGMLGPDLTHLMSRRRIAAGLLPNTVGNLGGWVANTQTQKPGCGMPAMELPGEELQAILAYLQTLR